MYNRRIPVSYTHLDVYKRQVIPGKPAGIVPHHTMPAHEDVLQGIIKGMTHVELTGYDHAGLATQIKVEDVYKRQELNQVSRASSS